MKPLPNLNDEAAMLMRGKRSALLAARNDAVAGLRDLVTAVQGTHPVQLSDAATALREFADRFDALAAMQDGIDATTEAA